MPCIIICTDEAGQVLVNAMAEVPPEFLEGAQPAASLEEAAALVPAVLGAEGAGNATGAEATGGGMPAEEAQPGAEGAEPPIAAEDEDDPMQAGFNRAKKGL
jgi:hypothetical protein